MTAEATAKPLPIVTPLDEPYWAYTRQGELRIQRCTDCHAFRYPSSALCPDCGSERSAWERVSGRGAVFSWVVFHKCYFPGFAGEMPYNVAMIRLDEGPLFIANIVDVDNAAIRTGMRVEVVFDRVDERFTIPRFRPA